MPPDGKQKPGRSAGAPSGRFWRGWRVAAGGVHEPLINVSRADGDRTGAVFAGRCLLRRPFLSARLFDLFLMNLPVEGEPLEVIDFFKSIR